MLIEINRSTKITPYETGDVDKSITSSFVQTIEADDIRDTQLDLSEIIANKSGIKIRQMSGLGSYSQISIRGKSADQVMVYMDGVLLNNASGGSVDLSQIPTSQIARIEIYKDVIPVEFSEASNGGVINIITHRAINQKSTSINAGMGSFSTFNLGMDYFDYYKKWQFVLTGGIIKSENDFPFKHDNGTPDNPVDDQNQTRNNNQLSQYNIIAKAKYHIDTNRSIEYQSEIFDKVKQIPSLSNNPRTQTSLSDNIKKFRLNYIDSKSLSNSSEFNLGLNVSLKDTLYDDREKQINYIKQFIDQKTQLFAGKIYLKHKNRGYNLINNTSIRYENLEVTDYLDEKNDRLNRRLTLSSAFEGHFYSQAKKMIVSPGVRFFISQDRFKGNTLNESNNKPSLEKNYFNVSPQIGLRYQLWYQTSFKFNAGKYYRLPNYTELFGTRGFVGSNETLKPEKGYNFDAGFEHLSYPKSETLTRFNWDLSLFHSIIKDEIVYSFDARGIAKPSNNRKSTITGIENNINLEFNYAQQLTSSTTLQLPLNRSDSDDIKFLPGRSYFTQTTRLISEHDPIELFFEHIWESMYFFDSEEQLLNDAKSIFNAGIKMHSKIAKYSVVFNNIFNTQYRDYYTQVAPGFAVFLSANFTFT